MPSRASDLLQVIGFKLYVMICFLELKLEQLSNPTKSTVSDLPTSAANSGLVYTYLIP